jgi:hypothetical protein
VDWWWIECKRSARSRWILCTIGWLWLGSVDIFGKLKIMGIWGDDKWKNMIGWLENGRIWLVDWKVESEKKNILGRSDINGKLKNSWWTWWITCWIIYYITIIWLYITIIYYYYILYITIFYRPLLYYYYYLL